MSESAARPGAVEIRTVAVIGAGVAGRSFALVCVTAGFQVVLEDVMPANLRKAEAEFADLDHPVETGHLRLASTVEDAVRAADIAVDFVPDELESKLEIFSLIDRMAPPRTILCTPSDALSITDLASCVYRPQRCVAVRGQLIPSQFAASTGVRLLHPEAVTSDTLDAVQGFLVRLGLQVRVELDPDVPSLMKNILKVSSPHG